MEGAAYCGSTMCIDQYFNFFELAVAVVTGVFGLGSGEALATVVGVLLEVSVMLSLVAFADKHAENSFKHRNKEIIGFSRNL